MRSVCLTVSMLLLPAWAAAVPLTIQFTNVQPAGGFSTAPAWVAVHDGNFDFFDAGEPASEFTEFLAELGVPAGLTCLLGSHGQRVILATDVMHPQFTPGETKSMTLDIADPRTQRWLSYAFMLIPSNDFFYANDDPRAYEIFDADGDFKGPLTIRILGAHGWDALTEVNSVNLGIAFLVGRDAVGGLPETGVVRPLFSLSNNVDYLAQIVGMDTPVYTVTDGLTPDEVLATIRISLPNSIKGDLNCDGNVDFGDINAFVLALGNEGEYRRQYPDCDYLNADINGDGHVDFGDINPFVDLLS